MNCLSHYLRGILPFNILPAVFGLVVSLFLLNSQVTSVNAQAINLQDQVVTLINGERSKNNLAAYTKSSALTTAAQNHNKTMYNCSLSHEFSSCFSHQVTVSNEEKLISRISSTGYNPKSVAENIAWGQTTAQQVVTAWMNSSGHKANILSPNYRNIGCSLLDTANGSYKGMWWTCNFGTSSNVNTAPSVSPEIKPSPSVKASAVPSVKASASPSPFVSSKPNSRKPGWCKYIPNHRFCN